MKSWFLVLFWLLPAVTLAQRVLYLDVAQPPELGFVMGCQDTTISLGSQVTLGGDLVISGGTGEYTFLWSPASSLDNPLTLHPVANPTDTTTYLLTVTDQQGCSFQLTYTVHVKPPLVGHPDHPARPRLQAVVYPHPGDGLFKIRLSGNPAPMVTLSISDHTGKVINKRHIGNFPGYQEEELRLRLPAGFYILSVDNGTEQISRPLIIR
ncbi:MAG: T9SS type A sorting domain-containing protein [Bacteroidales bacterium]|nr:T9SS type A sorting domain-containing protein [Bacteroidales bacterium]